MKWLAVLLTICLLACSGDDEQQTIEIERIDVSYGVIGDSYENFEYLIGPKGVLTLHETAGKNLRIIVHIKNDVPIQSQHLLMIDDNDEVEQVHYFEPVLQPTTGENQTWTVGWDIFVLSGELSIGEFELCVWVEGNEITSDVECLEFEVLEGEGKLKPKNLKLKRIK